MKFLLDAQLPPGLARRLREAGHEATHVRDVGLRHASDQEVWRFAPQHGLTLISKDRDFVDVCLNTASGPAVVWLRLGHVTNASLWISLEPLLDSIVQVIASGERLVEIAHG